MNLHDSAALDKLFNVLRTPGEFWGEERVGVEEVLTIYIELPAVLHFGIRYDGVAAAAGEELAGVFDLRDEGEDARRHVAVRAHLWDEDCIFYIITDNE